MRIFINEHPVEVRENATLREAIEGHDEKLAASLAAGGYLTDATGCKIDADVSVEEGMILRAVVGGRHIGR